jgi:hypothetical protein
MDSTINEFELFSQIENFQLAWRRISRSTRYEVKDWLGLQIYGWQEYLDKNLEEIIERIPTYQPSDVYNMFRPKGDRSLRRFAFLSMDDRLLYQALGNVLILSSYEDMIRWSDEKKIFGNIPINPSLKSDFVFKRTFSSKHRNRAERVIGQYDLFRNHVFQSRIATLDNYENPWLIKTDIHSFYPSISHRKLLKLLAERHWLKDLNLHKLLETCLKKWSYLDDTKGLPVGYETSDYLANLYLLPLDERLSSFEVKRYVDDFYIFVPTFEDAKRAIKIFDDCLAELGLQRNGGKTKFLCLREVTAQDLEERLGQNLSFLAEEQSNQSTEIKRQQTLERLFDENYHFNNDVDNECKLHSVQDIRTLTFTLYRLNSTNSNALAASFHILDHYPQYSLQSVTYLVKNYHADSDVIERLRLYVNQEYETTKLKLDVLINLIKYRGLQFFEMEVEAALEYDDWFMKYSVLREVIMHTNLAATSAEFRAVIARTKNSPNPFVQSLAIWILFNNTNNADERRELINESFYSEQSITNKLGLYLSTRFNFRDVDFSLLRNEIREKFLQGPKKYEITEFRELFWELFEIQLHPDFRIGDVFGNLNDSLIILRTIRNSRSQGINDFIKAIFDLTKRLLHAVYNQQSPNNLRFSFDNFINRSIFDQDTVTHFYDLERDHKDVEKSVNLPNGRQESRLNSLRPVFRRYVDELHKHYVGADMRDQIFISYAHKDGENDKNRWLSELKMRLKPLERNGGITRVWSDSDIPPSSQWRTELNDALGRAKVAVLLVTPEFFSSDFIVGYELPIIYDAHRKGELQLIVISCRSTNYASYDEYLSNIQWANEPDKPLELLSEGERGRVWVSIIDKITKAFKG